MPPPDFAAMRKDPLLVEAKALGVQTRKEVAKVDGTKHRTWRSITDVAAECTIERNPKVEAVCHYILRWFCHGKLALFAH